MTPLQTQAINTALLGDWKEAVELNKSLIKDDPKDVDALNRLAFAFSILGKAKESKLAYQKVLKIDPLNTIALRNIKKIPSQVDKSKDGAYKLSNIFLEEPGKTKIIELVNIAPSEVINKLKTGELLKLSVKRLKIFVLSDNLFIGMLPDDIGRRLLSFIDGGNEYEAYIKSANNKTLVIFIKETKRAKKYKDQPSFVYGTETTLSLEKPVKKSKTAAKSKTDDEDDDEPYLEEEEV